MRDSNTRKRYEYTPAPVWHNVLYGLGSAVVLMGPLLIPGVDTVDVMLGTAVISGAIFLVVSLLGMFQGYLPRARQEQKRRH